MNTNKKGAILIFVMGFMLIASISLSDARLGNFPRGDCVDITTILNSSSVNISINFVNTSTAVLNQEMTKTGNRFNYTFCDTQEIGLYNYDYFDDEGQVFVNDFKISAIGDDIETGDSIIYIIVLISITILFVFFVLITINTPYDNIGEMKEGGIKITKITKTKYIKLIAAWISYGMFLWIITIVTGLANNYIWFGELRTLSTNLYTFLSALGMGVNITIIVLLFYNLWKDIIMSKAIKRYGEAWIEKGGPQ